MLIAIYRAHICFFGDCAQPWKDCLYDRDDWGVAPDVDMLRFYLIDNREHRHHSYLTHRPIIWAGILCAGIFVRRETLVSGTLPDLRWRGRADSLASGFDHG